MATLQQQHNEVLDILRENRQYFLSFMDKKVEIKRKGGSWVCGEVAQAGGYFIGIKNNEGQVIRVTVGEISEINII